MALYKRPRRKALVITILDDYRATYSGAAADMAPVDIAKWIRVGAEVEAHAAKGLMDALAYHSLRSGFVVRDERSNITVYSKTR